MARLIAAAIALVVAWIGVVDSSSGGTAVAHSPTTVHTYAYDGHHHSADRTQTALERGPPAIAYDYSRRPTAVDAASRAHSARPQPTTTLTSTDYDHTVRFASATGGPGTSRTASGGRSPELSAAPGARCAANGAGHAELAGGMRALLAERAGFSGVGPKILVDENLPSAWAAGLREAGFDARSVSEMGLRGASDPQLGQLADQVGARVLTRDVGHDIAGGFGSNGIVIDSRVRSLDTILRILEGG